ncbi:MAG: CoA-binding protein [Candidatus Thorarchaeota archaeon]
MVEIDHGFDTDMTYAIAGTFTGGLSSKGFRALKDEWFNVKKVYPICPDKDSVDDIKAYQSLGELPEPVDVVIVVHKPSITTDIVRQASRLDPKPAIWFMPRTDTPESIDICEQNGMKYARSCLMGHREVSGMKRFINIHYYHSRLGKMNRIPKQVS